MLFRVPMPTLPVGPSPAEPRIPRRPRRGPRAARDRLGGGARRRPPAHYIGAAGGAPVPGRGVRRPGGWCSAVGAAGHGGRASVFAVAEPDCSLATAVNVVGIVLATGIAAGRGGDPAAAGRADRRAVHGSPSVAQQAVLRPLGPQVGHAGGGRPVHLGDAPRPTSAATCTRRWTPRTAYA